MKVAILGPSLSALEMTLKLHELGASVRLFWTGESYKQELTTLASEGVVVKHPWLRVTKRFLLPGQQPKTGTRFSDLFRVTFQVDPTPIVEKSKIEQPELYEKMSEDFLTSLSGKLEMFEDFDVVIDASPRVPRESMGPGGQAVGESKLRTDTVMVMRPEADIASWVKDSQEVAIIGAGRFAQEAILKLQSWLNGNENRRAFVVTTETEPFKNTSAEFQKFISSENALQQEALKQHSMNDQAWLELDDFVKAKKPRPEIPIPRLVIFSGHVLTAIDQLVDKTRTFLTCETLPWEQGKVQPENNGVELKTVGVDKLIVATGTRIPMERFQGLDLLFSSDQKNPRSHDGTHPEIGFFSLGQEGSSEQQLGIINSLTKLFTRAGAQA